MLALKLSLPLFSFLFEAHVSVGALCTGPDILHTLVCELGVTLWCQEDCHTKIVCNELQHSLLIEEIIAHSHYMPQVCAVIKRHEVIFLTASMK